MPCFQPEIMIVDGFDQNRPHTCAICAQHIREDLIADQRTSSRRHLVASQAGFDTLRKGLICVGDAIDAVGLAEGFDPVFMAVRNHTQGNFRLGHHLQPPGHLLGRLAGGIRHDGVIKIQHQKADPLFI